MLLLLLLLLGVVVWWCCLLLPLLLLLLLACCVSEDRSPCSWRRELGCRRGGIGGGEEEGGNRILRLAIGILVSLVRSYGYTWPSEERLAGGLRR